MFLVCVCLPWCFCLLVGVFGDEVTSVSVMEGESVTLHNNDKQLMSAHLILWKFGPQETLIVRINKEASKSTKNDTVYDGMFRDRLQVDDQTGSLTITNFTTQHSGVYQMIISGKQRTSYRFSVTVYARLPVPVISRDSSQCSSPLERSSVCKCVLLCSVMNVSHVSLSWYKGISLLSSISVSDQKNNISLHLECLDDSYSCVVNNSITNQTQHLNTDDCHKCSGLTFIHIVVMFCVVVGSLKIVTAVLICCICRQYTEISSGG